MISYDMVQDGGHVEELALDVKLPENTYKYLKKDFQFEASRLAKRVLQWYVFITIWTDMNWRNTRTLFHLRDIIAF